MLLRVLTAKFATGIMNRSIAALQEILHVSGHF
jgi:hypothetical protein